MIKGRVMSQMIHEHIVARSDGTVEKQEHDSGQSGVIESTTSTQGSVFQLTISARSRDLPNGRDVV